MRKHKAAALAVFLCCLAALTALAAGATLKLNAGDPVATQAAAFRGYLDKLSAQDRAQWLEELEDILDSRGGMAPLRLYAEPSGTAEHVYIVGTGKVYHLHRGCSTLSRSKNVQEVTLEQALAKGRRPCKVCGGT